MQTNDYIDADAEFMKFENRMTNFGPSDSP